MLNVLSLFLIHLGGYMFILGCVLILPLSLLTVPYLNKKLGLKKLYNPLGQDFLMGSSSIQYATMIVFNKRTRKSYYTRAVFGSTELRANARFIDKLLSFSFVILACGGGIILLVSGIFYEVIQIFI